MSHKRLHINQVKELLLVWSLGLISGIFLFFSFLIFLSSILSGLPSLSEGSWKTLNILMFIVFLFISLFLIPTMLSAYWSNFKLGLKRGFSSIFVGLFGFFIGWYSWSYLSNLFYTGRIYREPFIILMPYICSAAVIIWIKLINKKILDSYIVFTLGIINSLILSFVIYYAYGSNILFGESDLNLLWIIPPIVWVTVVYFVQRGQGYKSWQGMAAWLGLVALSFLLPLLVSQTPLWLFR